MWNPFRSKKKQPAYNITLGVDLGEWSKTDALRIQGFLDSHTGRKLMARREMAAHRMAMDPHNTSEFYNGIRAGKVVDLQAIKELAYYEEDVEQFKLFEPLKSQTEK